MRNMNTLTKSTACAKFVILTLGQMYVFLMRNQYYDIPDFTSHRSIMSHKVCNSVIFRKRSLNVEKEQIENKLEARKWNTSMLEEEWRRHDTYFIWGQFIISLRNASLSRLRCFRVNLMIGLSFWMVHYFFSLPLDEEGSKPILSTLMTYEECRNDMLTCR